MLKNYSSLWRGERYVSYTCLENLTQGATFENICAHGLR